MRTRTVKRYYCDHCKKAGLSRFHMEKHERGCTANPNRVCGMCQLVDGPNATLPELLDAARIGLTELRSTALGCPACMLAGIRALRATFGKPSTWGEYHPLSDELREWEFKKEKDSFWADFNIGRRELEEQAIYFDL